MPRFAAVFAVLCFMAAGPVLAGQTAAEPVFGESLMTRDEVVAFKAKLASCATAQEREQVEAEHKDHMIQRARWKGLVLDRGDKSVTMAGN